MRSDHGLRREVGCVRRAGRLARHITAQARAQSRAQFQHEFGLIGNALPTQHLAPLHRALSLNFSIAEGTFSIAALQDTLLNLSREYDRPVGATCDLMAYCVSSAAGFDIRST